MLSIEMAIRQYLENHGIKQTFVSDRCGWTKQKTNAIVTGKRRITADEYGTICEAVGVPYDYFFAHANTGQVGAGQGSA